MELGDCLSLVENVAEKAQSRGSGILHGARKNILLRVKKAKLGPQSPKMEFGAQNQYGRVLV
jgi:hypothetical protein